MRVEERAARTGFPQIDDGLDAQFGQILEAFFGGLSTAVEVFVDLVEIPDPNCLRFSSKSGPGQKAEREHEGSRGGESV